MTHIFIYGIPGYDEGSVERLLLAGENVDENELNVKVIRPSELLSGLTSAITQNNKLCLIFVIQKGRIKIQIEELPKSELKLIFGGALPVILLITDCNSARDEDWWSENSFYFNPYGIVDNFLEVIHGTTDKFNEQRYQLTQDRILRSLRHARRVDPEMFKNRNILGILLSHVGKYKIFYALIVPCIILLVTTPKLMEILSHPSTALDSISTTPTREEFQNLLLRVQDLEEKLLEKDKHILSLTQFHAKLKAGVQFVSEYILSLWDEN